MARSGNRELPSPRLLQTLGVEEERQEGDQFSGAQRSNKRAERWKCAASVVSIVVLVVVVVVLLVLLLLRPSVTEEVAKECDMWPEYPSSALVKFKKAAVAAFNDLCSEIGRWVDGCDYE